MSSQPTGNEFASPMYYSIVCIKKKNGRDHVSEQTEKQEVISGLFSSFRSFSGRRETSLKTELALS